MSTPASLRDLYAPPPHAWSFAPPSANGTDAAPPPGAPAPAAYQWSRPGAGPLLGLSGAAAQDEDGVDVKALLAGLLTAALLQYGTTAITMPWEVGRTCLQVQWIPRDIDAIPARDYVKEPEEEEEVCVC